MRRTSLLVAALVVGAGFNAVPAHADPTPRDQASIPSFNESPGCGELSGFRGPYATHRSGRLGNSEPIRGPWGDFFGRTVGQVRSDLVPVRLPMSQSSNLVFWVHERVVPALNRVAANLRAEQAKGRHYTIRTRDSGSFRPSTVPPGRHLSFHTIGASIDINSRTNPYRGDNVLITDMPSWFVKAWTDAGWCWGGDWQTIKDAMHFSWMGPAHTPGYDVPPPYPPRTTRDRRYTREIGLAASSPPVEIGVPLIADFDRDGAADLGRVQPGTLGGHAVVTWAQSHHGFETCLWSETTRTRLGTNSVPVAADFTGDGRTDVALVGLGEATATLRIHPWERLRKRPAPLPTSVPTVGITAVAAGDSDADGIADIFVLRKTDGRTRLEIWRGPDHDVLDESIEVHRRVEGGRLAVGDSDLDGLHDAYVLAGDGTLVIYDTSSGLTGSLPRRTGAVAAPGEAFFVHDYDGDGWRDLWLATTGLTARVFLGGVRSPGADLDGWFIEDTPHHLPGAGCHPAPAEPFPGGAADGVGARHGWIGSTALGESHRISLHPVLRHSAWSFRAAGDPVLVVADPALVADLYRTNHRVRIDVRSATTGAVLWSAGLGRTEDPVGAWFDPTGALVVVTSRPGTVRVITYRDGEVESRVRIDGLQASGAAPFDDGIALLRADGGGGAEIVIFRGGTLSDPSVLPGTPLWMAASGSGLVALSGLEPDPTVLTVVLADTEGNPQQSVAATVGTLRHLAATANETSVGIAGRPTSGRPTLAVYDSTTGLMTFERNLPMSVEPVAVAFASDTSVAVVSQRWATGDIRLRLYGL